jgi:PIN domain nuclease of toxin-antitoxin system
MVVGETREARQEGKEEVNGYLLDTHVWLWIMQGESEKVSARFFAEVEDWQRQRLVYLSPISCWELGLLVSAKKYRFDRPIDEIWEQDTNPESYRVAELTGPILFESTHLPGDLHRDPSDRILAATARSNRLTLVTQDWRLLDYAKQGHLKARKP